MTSHKKKNIINVSKLKFFKYVLIFRFFYLNLNNFCGVCQLAAQYSIGVGVSNIVHFTFVASKNSIKHVILATFIPFATTALSNVQEKSKIYIKKRTISTPRAEKLGLLTQQLEL